MARVHKSAQFICPSLTNERGRKRVAACWLFHRTVSTLRRRQGQKINLRVDAYATVGEKWFCKNSSTEQCNRMCPGMNFVPWREADKDSYTSSCGLIRCHGTSRLVFICLRHLRRRRGMRSLTNCRVYVAAVRQSSEGQKHGCWGQLHEDYGWLRSIS